MRTLDVRNPRSGNIDHHIEIATTAEVSAIADRLKKGQPAWSENLEVRLDAMERWAQAMEAARDDLVAASVADTGRRSV